VSWGARESHGKSPAIDCARFPGSDDDSFDFDIDDFDDADVPDDVALERQLGQSWRSGHPFREDA